MNSVLTCMLQSQEDFRTSLQQVMKSNMIPVSIFVLCHIDNLFCRYRPCLSCSMLQYSFTLKLCRAVLYRTVPYRLKRTVSLGPVLQIRIRRIPMFLDLPDLDPLVRGTIYHQANIVRKTSISTVLLFVTSLPLFIFQK
jgi:hypothetical protein